MKKVEVNIKLMMLFLGFPKYFKRAKNKDIVIKIMMIIKVLKVLETMEDINIMKAVLNNMKEDMDLHGIIEDLDLKVINNKIMKPLNTQNMMRLL